MAVSTINPWAAGAVVLDQRPFLQFYERQMAREQAKNDALDNYFKDLGKNVTSAGMRSQDVPGFLQMNKAWQDHYIQNKDAILHPQKDGGKALNEYNAGYQNQIALTNESKGLQKDDEQLAKLKFNKDTQYIFDDPDIMKNMQASQLPIGHPQHKRFDIVNAMIPPKPLTAKDREEYSKYIIGDTKQDKIPGTPVNIGNFQTQTPITHQYSEQNKKLFGDRAADFYDSANKDWKADANNLFKSVMHDDALHNQLNTIYKRHYGHDIDSPRDAFIAKTILDHDVKTMEYKEGEDKWGQMQAAAKLHHDYALDEISARQRLKNKSEGEQNNIIEGLYKSLKLDAIKNPKTYEPAKGQPFTQYEMKASGAVKNMFATKDADGHTIYPDAVRYSQDFKTITPIFFEHYVTEQGNKRLPDIIKDKSGRAKVIENLSRPVLEAEFKQRWKKELMGTSGYNKDLNKDGDDDDNAEEIDMDALGKKYNF